MPVLIHYIESIPATTAPYLCGVQAEEGKEFATGTITAAEVTCPTCMRALTHRSRKNDREHPVNDREKIAKAVILAKAVADKNRTDAKDVADKDLVLAKEIADGQLVTAKDVADERSSVLENEVAELRETVKHLTEDVEHHHPEGTGA